MPRYPNPAPSLGPGFTIFAVGLFVAGLIFIGWVISVTTRDCQDYRRLMTQCNTTCLAEAGNNTLVTQDKCLSLCQRLIPRR